jgi:2,3-bisphosphoglycerate-independent phosphoglycerate mutase
MIVLDGVGDLPSPALGGLTPLEAAATPRLDALAAEGLCGMVDPLFPGLPVDTHTGTALLMGLAPVDAMFLSRGPVEAAGVGAVLDTGDVAVRANFATVQSEGGRLRVLDRRAGRIRSHTHELASALTDLDLGDGISGTLTAGTQHRSVVCLRGQRLSGNITDTDPGSRMNPGWVKVSEPVIANEPDAARTADALNRFVRKAYERLRDHAVNDERRARGELPATGVVTRGAGTMHRCRSIVRHSGLQGALVAGERTVIGLGRLFGFEIFVAPGFNALPTTDLDGKMSAVNGALQDHDLVFLHIKATDVCAHDRKPLQKRDFLQRFDAVLQQIVDLDELVVAVSGDHSTDSNTGVHCGDPVPSVLRVPGGRRDRVNEYGESACFGGGLGRISSPALLVSMLDGMGRLTNYQPHDRELYFV